MKQFLESLIKSIVEKPDAVSISEEHDDQGRELLIISVDPEDMGRVIGKSGKVINAVRTIMRVVAIRQGVKVRIDLKDEALDRPQQESAVESEPEATESVQEIEPSTPTAADLVQAPKAEKNTESDDSVTEKVKQE